MRQLLGDREVASAAWVLRRRTLQLAWRPVHVEDSLAHRPGCSGWIQNRPAARTMNPRPSTHDPVQHPTPMPLK